MWFWASLHALSIAEQLRLRREYPSTTAFGNFARPIRVRSFMGALTANLGYALRMMRRSPGFSAVAVAALAWESGPTRPFSIPKYMAWRNNRVFQWMTLYDRGGLGLNLGYGDRPEQVRGARASKDYFNVCSIRPLIGRTFTDAEDAPRGANVAVISYGL
jgi:putative ABC transport system permease protein